MGGMSNYVSAGLQLAQAVGGQQRASQQAQAQAEAQNQLLLQQQAIKEKQQRDLLQRQLATARAKLSASGIGVGSGSGAALLSGMVKGTESDIADAQGMFNARQAFANAGASSSDGLLEGLNLVNRSWNLFGQSGS